MPAFVTALAQISLPGLGGEGPGEVEQLLTTFYLLLAVGFFVGVMGHLFKSRTLVIAGIALIFLGTGVFVVAIGAYG